MSDTTDDVTQDDWRCLDIGHTEGDTKECPDCEGQMKWCTGCNMWTKTCCEEYGTCECS